MYTSNFVANSDYLISNLLKQHVICDELDSRQILYEVADNVIDTKNIITSFPRISNQITNIGKYPLEVILPMISNTRADRQSVSAYSCERYHKSTKLEYLNLDATNYMIVAKPGIETFQLAKKMEEMFRCIHIDCDRLVEREIKSKTRLGIWLDKNLQLNKILPIEIILWLIQRETTTCSVIYSGYILTGLPLIPNTDLNMKKNFCTEDDFLIFKQIIDELIDSPITYRKREMEKLKKMLFSEYPILEDDTDELKQDVSPEPNKSPEGFRPLPKLFHRICSDRDVRFSIKRQLYFTLDLKKKPTILIYIDCDDEDIITNNITFNKKTPEEIDGIRIALKHYNDALDIIQQFVCHFPKVNVVYCQGIYSTEETFKSCMDKIKDNCCRKHIFTPFAFFDLFKDDENVIEELEAASDSNLLLDILCKINSVRGDFGWFRSDFEGKCPVMLTQGKCVIGKYQYSVQFTGLIFLLSSDENKRIFMEQPQFFIGPFPSCRIGLMGTRCSGKSTFARCIAKFFENSIIIDVNYLFEYYRKIDIEKLYFAEACGYAIALVNSQSLEEYQKQQQIRQVKIDEWISEMTQNIIGFLKPIPTKGKTKSGLPKPVKKAAHENERLKNLLNEFGFETDDPTFLGTYLSSEDLFLTKLPPDISKNVIFRESRVGDTEVDRIVAERMNEMGKDHILPMVRKLEILVTKIRLCEKRQKILTKQKKLYGDWILDDLPPDMELIQGLQEMDCLPDVLVFMDDSVGERLAENQNIKCHREFYDVNYVFDTVVNTKQDVFKHMLNKTSMGCKKEDKFFGAQVVRRELDHVLIQDSLQGTIDYAEENGKYRERFDEVKTFLEPTDTYVLFVDIHGMSWTDAMIRGVRDYMNYFNAHPHVVLQDESSEMNESDEKNGENLILYGTTAEYCPVLFVDKTLLKLGLSQYSVKLKNRTYFLSTQQATEKFVKNPFKYSEIERPYRIPPYRLCVIGNYHVAKRSDLRRIADILGTKHVIMDNIINLHFEKNKIKENFNVTNFYEILQTLGDSLVKDIVAPLFNDGFIIEDFPVTAEHLEQMIELTYCPEQIFYLKIENKHLIKDELKYYMNQYKEVLLTKINKLQEQNKHWMTQRKLRFGELFATLTEEFVDEQEEEEEGLEEQSDVDLDIVAKILNDFDLEADSDHEIQKKQLYVADLVNNEMPQDQYTKLIDELMKFQMKQEVKDFIQTRVEEFNKIKLVAEEHLIPFIEIRLHPYTTKEIEKTVLKYIKESTDRQYIFERVQPISFANAVAYLRCGQFSMSRYYWTCPVRNLDLDYPIKLSLKTPDLDQKLQPFIHQNHLYFVQRVYHNVDNFFARPYLYTNSINICQITKYLGLVVHGPGLGADKELCERITKEFQLKVFTLKGMKEFVVKNFKWTKLATELLANEMQISNNQQICDLVKIAVNFETRGWVLRDLPLDMDLVKCFQMNSLDIHLVIYMNPTGKDMWSDFINNYKKDPYKRKMEVIQQLYSMVTSLEDFSTHTIDFKGLNQNVITIIEFISRYRTWNKVYREILLLLRLFNLYGLRECQKAAVSVYKLNVCDVELQFRLSRLQLYCPLCFINSKLLIKYKYPYIDDEEAESLYSDNLYDKNIFQYCKYFYWSCNSHLVELTTNADTYLPTTERLPKELPKLVKDVKDHVITNQGYCPVAYFESGNENVVIGLPEYSIFYFEKIYVMSSEDYCLKFLQDPGKYKNIQIRFVYSQRSNDDEDLKKMQLDFGSITPTLLINGLLECSLERPKHYGLDPSQSLEIYLGLYLKCHNSISCDDKINFYKAVFLKFWNDCKLLQRSVYEKQVSGNPYIRRKKKTKLGYRGSSISTFGF